MRERTGDARVMGYVQRPDPVQAAGPGLQLVAVARATPWGPRRFHRTQRLVTIAHPVNMRPWWALRPWARRTWLCTTNASMLPLAAVTSRSPEASTVGDRTVSLQAITVEQGLQAAGVGRFQYRLFSMFSLVWLAAAMQVLAVGFTAPSISATFEISLSAALHTGTAFFVGMLIGALALGRLADRIGRRPVLTATVLFNAAFGFASAFAVDLQGLLLLRVLAGIGVGGTLPVVYTMMAEFLPSDRRGRWLVFMESFWAVGTVVLGVLSLFAVQWDRQAWRVIFSCTSLPLLIGVAFKFFLTESPVYLTKAGRANDARWVLQHVGAINGVSVPMGTLQAQPKERSSVLELFSADCRRRTVCLLIAWTLVSLSYYGLLVYLPVKFSGEGLGFMRGQVFLIVLALAQLPSFAIAAYGVERWGRKATLIGFLLLSAGGCTLYGLGSATTVVVAATLLASFALLGTWGALYALTPEVFPTQLRATGTGAAGAAGRLGGLLAPSLIAPVMARHFTSSLVLLSTLLVVAAISISIVDVERKGRSLD